MFNKRMKIFNVITDEQKSRYWQWEQGKEPKINKIEGRKVLRSVGLRGSTIYIKKESGYNEAYSQIWGTCDGYQKFSNKKPGNWTRIGHVWREKLRWTEDKYWDL